MPKPSLPDPWKVTRGPSGRNVVERTDGLVVCDFCLAEAPAWEYPAAPMEVVAAHIGRSLDEWAACDECRRLIDAHRIGELVERMVREQARVIGGYGLRFPPVPIARRTHRRNVLRFMDARTGPAVPYQA